VLAAALLDARQFGTERPCLGVVCSLGRYLLLYMQGSGAALLHSRQIRLAVLRNSGRWCTPCIPGSGVGRRGEREGLASGLHLLVVCHHGRFR
jgi:hypothetical protein